MSIRSLEWEKGNLGFMVLQWLLMEIFEWGA
jgi:hypothetical protein